MPQEAGQTYLPPKWTEIASYLDFLLQSILFVGTNHLAQRYLQCSNFQSRVFTQRKSRLHASALEDFHHLSCEDFSQSPRFSPPIHQPLLHYSLELQPYFPDVLLHSCPIFISRGLKQNIVTVLQFFSFVRLDYFYTEAHWTLQTST